MLQSSGTSPPHPRRDSSRGILRMHDTEAFEPSQKLQAELVRRKVSKIGLC